MNKISLTREIKKITFVFKALTILMSFGLCDGRNNAGNENKMTQQLA
jgi:hypothetical protein